MINYLKNPIGIFDSGIGGISIWKEINNLLPNENTIYLADSKNAPYGIKTKEAIINLCVKNTEILLEKNCKLIVVACNTATTNAIKHLRNTYSVPFIGIEPAIKSAALKTKTKTVGVLATKGTLNSNLFAKTSSKFDKSIKIIEQVGEGLVELIENNKLKSKETYILLQKYIQTMLTENIDCLVLGCTHYPYLIPQIKKIVGEKIIIIDSGKAVAKQSKFILNKFELLNSSISIKTHYFFTNKNIALLNYLLKNIKNTSIKLADF